MRNPVAARGEARITSTEEPRAARVAMLGLGTAVPNLRWSQLETMASMARIWNLNGAALDRWQRIVSGCGIENRFGVMPPEMVAPLTTAQRMAAFEQHAPDVAARAAVAAMRNAGVDAASITDVVVVSCTGFAAPGLDVALIDRLELPLTTRRTTIGFMGCFGAINGLRIASGLCAADPNAVVLLVCAELCSLHMRMDDSPQNMVASALFADGAAAAVLAGSHALSDEDRNEAAKPAIGMIGRNASMLMPEGRDWMTWRVTDHGFAMTLTRDVPVALRRNIRSFVDGLDHGKDDALIVHPGGPGVVDAVDNALELRGERGIECARNILRDFGNMSSATALFVLEEALRRDHEPPLMMLAFGPGLTIEGVRIDPGAE